MGKIKLFAVIMLFSVGFIFNGELYMLYLDNFYEKAKAEMELGDADITVGSDYGEKK